MDGQGERKLVQFYQYQEWPSHKAINSQNIRSLVQLMNQSETWKSKLEANHVTVVSSSGIGRAGVFIALASLQEEANTERSVDVFRSVQQLNQQRCSLVQTREEYSLIYTATLQITEDARRAPIIDEQKNDEVDVEKGVEAPEPQAVSGGGVAPKTKPKPKKSAGVKFQEEGTGVAVKQPLQRVNTGTNDSKM